MTFDTGKFVCTNILCIVLRLIELLDVILAPEATLMSKVLNPRAVASFSLELSLKFIIWEVESVLVKVILFV